MQNKKGAVELSMSTIIVVILGITLLSLGLVWIRGNLGKVTDLSDQAFDLSEQQIQDLFSDTDSTLKIKPNSVDLKKGKAIEVGVILYNNKPDTQKLQLSGTVNSIAAGTPLSCKFGDTLTGTSKPYELASGESKVIKLRIETVDQTTLGSGGCDVILNTGDTEQVLVTVTG